jgi:hypothetical protein
MKCTTYDQFLQMVNTNDGIDHWYEFGKLTDQRIKQLNKSSGKDLTGYSRIITKSAVLHSLERHGPKSTDLVKIAIEDFALIPFIVKGANKISLSKSKTKSNDLECVKYEKLIGDKYYYVEEIRTGRNKLALKTLLKTPAK